MTSKIVGTASDGSKVTGDFTPLRFVKKDGKQQVKGLVQGVVTHADGTKEKFAALRTLKVKKINGKSLSGLTVKSTQSLAACDILHLVLGPLDLDLLGLQIHLDKIVLDIVAATGAGNLLGNLLCAITGHPRRRPPGRPARPAQRPARPDPGCPEPGHLNHLRLRTPVPPHRPRRLAPGFGRTIGRHPEPKRASGPELAGSEGSKEVQRSHDPVHPQPPRTPDVWLLVVFIVVALVICSRPLPAPPRHRAEPRDRSVNSG